MADKEKQAVEKGGSAEYIKEEAKSGVVDKRSLNDHKKVTKKITITADTDFLIDSLALIYGTTRGELVDKVVQITAVSYNLAVDITGERPKFGKLEIYKM